MRFHALPEITVCAWEFEPRSVCFLLYLVSYLYDPKPAVENVLAYFQASVPQPQMDTCLPTFLWPPPLTSQMLGQLGAPSLQAPRTGSALAAPRAMSALLVSLGKKKKIKVASRGNFISPSPSRHYSLPQRHQIPFQCISFPGPYLSLADLVACSMSLVVLKHKLHEHLWQQKQQFIKYFLNSPYHVAPLQLWHVINHTLNWTSFWRLHMLSLLPPQGLCTCGYLCARFSSLAPSYILAHTNREA